MKTSLLLRIASIATLVFAAGHILGGRESWSPVGETEVLRVMKSFRFDAEGVSRTYFDFYLGFGLSISVYLALQAVLLWQLARIAKVHPLRARPMIGSFLLASVALAVLSWKFIFGLPAISFAAIAAILVFAFFVASRPEGPQKTVSPQERM